MALMQQLKFTEMQSRLSTLWIFFLLNMIFRDIHEIGTPDFVQEAMSGFVNGNQVSDEMLLLGGFMIEVILLMVVLARFLPYRPNRWANIIMPLLVMASIFFFGVNDLDDIFFAAVEIVSLTAIVWLAWRWPNPQLQSI